MTSKLKVACELLNEALVIYYRGDSYFASIHLAGGAEEILGAYISHNGGIPVFKDIRDAAVRLSKYIDDSGIESKPRDIGNLMNHAKNSAKHMDNLNDNLVTFDAKYEAEAMIERAISNYYLLQQNPIYELKGSELISRFDARLSE